MPDYFIGLMSGTSMDGIDAVLVDFADRPLRLVSTLHQPWPEDIRQRMLTLAEQRVPLNLDEYGELDAELGARFADCVLQLLAQTDIGPGDVAAIGSHGQTVRHQPSGPAAFSLQIGDPHTIAEVTGIATVADFRRRDIAAGGQGAPLAPAFHRFLFADPREYRAVLNIGGMANLTLLPGNGGIVRGFDTGPGNVLLDSWCRQHLTEPFDRGGEWARSGTMDQALLDLLLDAPFFRQPPPRSTGRELFCTDWLQARLQQLATPPAAQDVQATLLELTVRSIADALGQSAADTERLLVCGGGAHNTFLMERLTQALPGCIVESTEACGLHPDWVEATAFAWLAKQTLAGKPGNLPAVTGASRPVVLGVVYPA